MSFDSKSSQILPEFNAIVVEADGFLTVEFIMGKSEQSPSELEEKLKKGDLILMMNANRLSTIATIRAQYDAIAVGDDIKIGVRRGEQRFIVRKTKGDIPKQGGGSMMISMDMDLGEGIEPVIVPELGLMIFDNDQHIEIAEIMPPLLPEALKKLPLKGYQISTINGQTFEDAEALKTYLAQLKVGDSMELHFTKNETEHTISVVKEKAAGAVNFNIKN